MSPTSGEIALIVDGSTLSGGRVRNRRVNLASGLANEDQCKGPVWRLRPDQLLIPAFHDHHTHLIGAMRPAQGPDLEGTTTRVAAAAVVGAWLGANPDAAPVLGEGWDESAWTDDPRPLTRADLDAIESRRPVALRRVCGHRAVLNSVAWRLLAPAGPEADESTGTITESLALGLPRRWPVPSEDYVSGAVRGQADAARAGVTGIDEMGRPATYRAFMQLAMEGRLWMRVRHFFPLEDLEALAESEEFVVGSGLAGLRVHGLKGFLDGSFGARTAAVETPYLDVDTRGMLLWSDHRLIEAVRAGRRRGYSIALHAIGRAACEQAIRAFEAIGPPEAGREHRIEHAEEIDLSLIGRAAAAGVSLSMQPNFTRRWQGQGGLYERALGGGRARGLNPYVSAATRARILFGSDMMPFGPLYGLQGALRHPDRGERLPLVDALCAYSLPGFSSGDNIEPWANRGGDAAVLRTASGRWDSDSPPEEISVIYTARAGRSVYFDPDDPPPAEFLQGLA